MDTRRWKMAVDGFEFKPGDQVVRIGFPYKWTVVEDTGFFLVVEKQASNSIAKVRGSFRKSQVEEEFIKVNDDE